jgi:hypothetical protein
MMLTRLPEILSAAGLRVEHLAGWQTRCKSERQKPRGMLCHHSPDLKAGNMPSLRILRDGRADIAAPLSQTLLARDGT